VKVGVVMPLAEQRGGAEMLLVRLLEANRKGAGVRYTLAFFEDGPLVSVARDLGYPAVVIPAGRMRQPHRVLGTVLALRRWMRAEGARVALSWMEKAHLYAGPAAASLRLPALWFVHSTPTGDRLFNTVAKLPAAGVLCCSEQIRRAAEEGIKGRFPAVRAYIGVDLDRFDPDRLPSRPEAKARIGQDDPAAPLVGMVARLQRWKGVHDFVRAAGAVSKRFPEARFVVVGGAHWDEADYPAELEALAEAEGLKGRLRFAGYQGDVPLWMRAMDVVVHASWNEPAGMVIIEGMALGNAVVAAETAGPMEFITHGEDGLLCPPGQPERLAGEIGRLLADEGERARLGAAARVRAAQFGTLRLAEDVAAALARAAEGRGPAEAGRKDR
jgi:glycosyltransferase involved in cell wall biosynthesis